MLHTGGKGDKITASRHSRNSQGLGKAFWRLWTATGVSSLGDGLVLVAFPLLAVSVTRNALAIAGVAIASRLPQLLFSLPLGALADRLDRRRLAIFYEGARLVVLAGFAATLVALGTDLWAIYVTVFLLGACEAGFVAATSACLPAVVSDDHLVRANSSLMVADITAEEVAGQAAGGILAAASISLPFVLDAVSFAGSALLLRGALPRMAPEGKKESLLADMRFGLAWFGRHRVLRRLALLIASFAFCQFVMWSILVLYGTRDLHLSRGGYGLFLSVGSVGMVLGALCAPRAHARLGSRGSVLFAGLATASAYIALGATHSLVSATAALCLEQIGAAIGTVATMALIQRSVPNHLLGRIMSIFRMVLFGAMPLGALCGGLLSQGVGLRPTFVTAGALQLVALAVFGRRLAAAPEATDGGQEREPVVLGAALAG